MNAKQFALRLLILLVLVLGGQLVIYMAEHTVDPAVATNMTLDTVNGDGTAAVAQRSYEAGRRLFQIAFIILYVAAAIKLWFPNRRWPSKHIPR